MREIVRQYWKPLAVGIVGTALVLGGLHVYQDHQDFHAMKAWALRVAQAQAAKAPPKAPTTDPEGK